MSIRAARMLCQLVCLSMKHSDPGRLAQMTKYPVFYSDVPSFIASLQKRHDSLLEDVDTNEPEGAALRVRSLCCRGAT